MNRWSAIWQRFCRHLDDYGISAWVACRCATEIVQGQFSSRREIVKQQSMDKMLNALEEFYGNRYSSLRYGYFGHWYPFRIPVSVRLRRGEKPLQLDQIMVRYMDGALSRTEQRRCFWISHVPLPNAVISPLVQAKRDEFSQLFRFHWQSICNCCSRWRSIEGARYTSDS